MINRFPFFKAVLTSSLFFSVVAFADGSPLRGYTEVNKAIVTRIAENNGFALGQYLDEEVEVPALGDLLGLLGTYVGSDTGASFRNGSPNSVNMLLWYIAINKLGENISHFCEPSFAAPKIHSLKLKPEFLEALLPLCAWPAKSAQDSAVLYSFWSSLLGFDAPAKEFDAWKNLFLTEPSYQTMTPGKVISDLVTSALYNPYFLLAD